MCVCMYVCMYIYIYVYVYMHETARGSNVYPRVPVPQDSAALHDMHMGDDHLRRRTAALGPPVSWYTIFWGVGINNGGFSV